MKAKSRLIITISAVVLALIASAVAVVAVVAARNVTVNTTFNITYQVVEVTGSIDFKYQTENAASPTSSTTTSFDGSEAENSSKSGGTLDLDISADNSHFVDLIFTFKNTNISKDMKVTITGLPTLTNMTMNSYDSGAGTYSVPLATNQTFTVAKATSAAAPTEYVYTVRVAVISSTQGAGLSGALGLKLESVNPPTT